MWVQSSPAKGKVTAGSEVKQKQTKRTYERIYSDLTLLSFVSGNGDESRSPILTKQCLLRIYVQTHGLDSGMGT